MLGARRAKREGAPEVYTVPGEKSVTVNLHLGGRSPFHGRRKKKKKRNPYSSDHHRLGFVERIVEKALRVQLCKEGDTSSVRKRGIGVSIC